MYKFWEDYLNKTYKDKDVIGGKLLHIYKYEDLITDTLNSSYKGFFVYIEDFIDFYYSTLQEFTKILNQLDKLSEKNSFFIINNVYTFHRLLAAYTLYKKGYFTESISLIRSLWESILMVVSINKGIITIPEIFAGTVSNNKKVTRREMANKIRESDRKIKDKLIWNNNLLSDDTKGSIKSLENIMNTATHKSKLNLLINYPSWIRGEKRILLLPELNKKCMEINMNLFNYITWCLLKTFSFMTDLIEKTTKNWQDRFHDIDIIITEIMNTIPNKTAKGIIDFVSVCFNN